MCRDWRGFLGRGLVYSGRRCSVEMEVCHHLLDLFLSLLELVGDLLVGDSKVFHRLSFVGPGLSGVGSSGG